jgi:hypothetical protein
VKRKFPLTTSHLQTIATASHTYDDLLFATILSYCFYGCHRIGELTQKNEHGLFDWRKVIKRSSLRLSPHRAQHHLPYNKSDPFYHGYDIPLTEQAEADPVRLRKRKINPTVTWQHPKGPFIWNRKRGRRGGF